VPRFESFDMPRITRGFLATVPAISPLDRSERPRGAEGLLGEERSTPLLSPRMHSCRSLCHLDGTAAEVWVPPLLIGAFRIADAFVAASSLVTRAW